MNKKRFQRITAGYDLAIMFELILEFNEECFHITPEETMMMLSRWYHDNTAKAKALPKQEKVTPIIEKRA